jgi:hypothetical protein
MTTGKKAQLNVALTPSSPPTKNGQVDKIGEVKSVNGGKIMRRNPFETLILEGYQLVVQ